MVAACMADEQSPPERVVVVTDEMAYGPHAVARREGQKVLFVRGAAPYEEVEVVVREERERFAFADLARVLRPSPARRPAPCPYLPRCGGCPWQHLDYPAQLESKRHLVAEQLRRIGGLSIAVAAPLPSPRQFGYRRRIKLRVVAGTVGFHAAASHDLVPVAHCLLAEPEVDAALPALDQLVAALASLVRRLEIIGGAPGGRVVVAGEIEGALATGDVAHAAAWLAAHDAIAGLTLRGRGWARTWGEVGVGVSADDGAPLLVRAPGFTQVNAAVNRLLVDAVVQLAGPRPDLRVLDLYAGAGNLSLPLRRRGAHVTAVEQDRAAAHDARANAAAEPGPPLRVVADRCESALRRLVAAGERFDVVVLDPPRGGAAACVPALLALRAPKLVYVSCDPATLARDLRALAAAYRVDVVQPLDMFPHTYHVETVVGATLSCDAEPPDVSSDRRLDRASAPRRRRTS